MATQEEFKKLYALLIFHKIRRRVVGGLVR